MKNIKISVGDIPISIYSDNAEFMNQCRNEYGNFFTDLKPEYIIEIKLMTFEDFKTLDFQFDATTINFNSLNGDCHIFWHNFFGELNLKTKLGKAVCIDHLGLNSFLRFIYSIILLSESGFLVHASSLIKEGKGYLFPGKSGTGKTTITRLIPDAKILTDDISLIKKVNGSYMAFSTPFWGELKFNVENITFPIDNIFFPVQDDKNYLENLSNLKALELLLPNILFFAENSELSRQLFELSHDFIIAVETKELHFLPEPTFWGAINDE